MNKYIVLVLSTVLMTACVSVPETVAETPPQWEEYYTSNSARAFVNPDAKPMDIAGVGLRSSFILINYAKADTEGTYSAIMSFALDCGNEMVKLDSFTAYNELYGQGDIIKKKYAPEVGFRPLDSFFNGDKIHALVCD